MVKTTKVQGGALEQVREHTSILEETNYATSTVRIKDIKVFLQATMSQRPLRLDKERHFTTSMDVEMRPPELFSYARLQDMINNSKNHEENNNSGVYHLIIWRTYNTEGNEFIIEIYTGLTKEELENANINYYSPRDNRGPVQGWMYKVK